ncbi:hypothetical protein EVAR_34830_1 [Eumeta japonica]|uniref:Uncharacterized protein n=1 Tax=Eumeta variegata TaxID=151549 RepID=A0A4C1YZE8_EUMVA|nr:hypothetical protein EVAR_34830_1 [Eumeta japonica]
MELKRTLLTQLSSKASFTDLEYRPGIEFRTLDRRPIAPGLKSKLRALARIARVSGEAAVTSPLAGARVASDVRLLPDAVSRALAGSAGRFGKSR